MKCFEIIDHNCQGFGKEREEWEMLRDGTQKKILRLKVSNRSKKKVSEGKKGKSKMMENHDSFTYILNSS